LRYCISLGRKAQNAVAEYGRLFNRNKDILLLRLNPLQHLVSFNCDKLLFFSQTSTHSLFLFGKYVFTPSFPSVL